VPEAARRCGVSKAPISPIRKTIRASFDPLIGAGEQRQQDDNSSASSVARVEISNPLLALLSHFVKKA